MGFHKTENTSYENVFCNNKYKVIVLDMDGTLYYQRKMQLLMCKEMLLFALLYPGKIWKLKAISVFRKIRESGLETNHQAFDTETLEEKSTYESLLDLQYGKTAEKMGRTEKQVKAVIEEWMFARPLKYMKCCQDVFLCKRVEKWQKEGIKVVVYSDYPAKDKCEALQMKPDGIYSSEEPEIGIMKPSPKGMEVIGRIFAAEPQEILVVGDRYSKDGKMAEEFGCDYVILEKWKCKRRKRYPA